MFISYNSAFLSQIWVYISQYRIEITNSSYITILPCNSVLISYNSAVLSQIWVFISQFCIYISQLWLFSQNYDGKSQNSEIKTLTFLAILHFLHEFIKKVWVVRYFFPRWKQASIYGNLSEMWKIYQWLLEQNKRKSNLPHSLDLVILYTTRCMLLQRKQILIILLVFGTGFQLVQASLCELLVY